MKNLILAAVALIVTASGGTGLYLTSVEEATVKISLPSWQLDSWATVHGAPTGGQFQTKRLHVELTETATGTASGTAVIGATYATGYVVFTKTPCPPANYYCPPPPARPGYEVCRVNPAGGAWCYVLQSSVTCYCGERVPVRARGPGSSFNAPANSVNYVGWVNPYVTVDNPAPISGGAGPASYPVVEQADLDAAAARLRAQVIADLQSALQVDAQGLRYVSDSAPAVVVSSSVVAGARGETFQVTASGTLGATAFRDADAQRLIELPLSDQVPDGFRLGTTPAITDYQIQDSNQQGDVTVTGKASGSLVAKFSVDSLRSKLRGLDMAAAHHAIDSVAPGSLVEIRLAPVLAPWLPLNANHISISIVMRPVTKEAQV